MILPLLVPFPPPVLCFAHTRFRLDCQWDSCEAVLQLRCTDETTYVQATLAELGQAPLRGLISNYLPGSNVRNESPL